MKTVIIGGRRKKKAIIHRMLLGQSGNDGIEYEVIPDFVSTEEAKRYIHEKCQINGWHDYLIVDQIERG